MRTVSVWTSRMVVLLLVIYRILLGVLPAGAFEPSHDYWFAETLVVSDVELPAQLSIRTADSAATPRGLLVIENQSDTLLYVLSLNYLDVLVQKTPDPNWKTRVNMAHEVASYLVAPDRPASLNTNALLDLDPHLVDRNVLSADPPLENVTIPASQNSKLLLVYGQQVLVVPFTLTYALNTHFNNSFGSTTQPTATTPATGLATATPIDGDSNQGAGNKMIAAGVAGIVILAVAGWLMWRGQSRR